MYKKTKKEVEKDPGVYLSVVDGLKKIYETKIKPLEEMYQFHEFHSPLLRDSDFDAKPTVLLLGQYSTGKTSFIKYLLERDFPGAHIGPEPTTDRWMAVMYGDSELITPGNALAIQADKPFRALSKFGNDFLTKFQSSQLPAPILEDITFIDTPGVLSGEKQRIGRTYDYVNVCEWFAEKADRIILLFDAHKLDISDEFKRVIEALKGHDDKIRVILNKADMVNAQQLMRVYGALMWSLGKVMQTPEVVRVYIGSFWDQPFQNEENRKLFEAEQADLFKDLASLPRNAAVRKINELVKRSRLAKVHAYIISHLRAQMPSVFGKSSKQTELIKNLKQEFIEIHKKYQLPVGDFPIIARFQEQLTAYDFSKFAKLNPKVIQAMDQVLGDDIPKLMKQFPQETVGKPSATNPFENNNPFDNLMSEETISNEDRQKYLQTFLSLNPTNGKVSGSSVKQVLVETGLPREILSKVWVLSDRDKDGQLNEEEFVICMYLVNISLAGQPLPDQLPQTLRLPSVSHGTRLSSTGSPLTSNVNIQNNNNNPSYPSSSATTPTNNTFRNSSDNYADFGNSLQ